MQVSLPKTGSPAAYLAESAHILSVQCLHTSVPEHLMGAVLNGALVGLCREEGQDDFRSTGGAPITSPYFIGL